MASPYDKIVDMIKKLDIDDDGIVLNRKIKVIERDFCELVMDERMLSDSMQYINDAALKDQDTAQKFAFLFSSRNFDSLAMKDTKVRYAMINVLQNNFLCADKYRTENKDILYNSIALLGEYYNRIRLSNQMPIDILGESLLELLIQEVNANNEHTEDKNMDIRLSKLILKQITLNGFLLRANHKTQLNLLLYQIRRKLIEVDRLEKQSKAFLLMTLDLYYNNFNSLDVDLETMYTKYLLEDLQNAEKSNSLASNSTSTIQNSSVQPEEFFDNFRWSEEVANTFNAIQPSECDEKFIHHPDNVSLSTKYGVVDGYNKQNSKNNRHDDIDHVSFCSDSIRHYNINDRLKNPTQHARNFPNSNAKKNSNWDPNNENSCDRQNRSISRNSNNYQHQNGGKHISGGGNSVGGGQNRGYNQINRAPRFSNQEHRRNSRPNSVGCDSNYNNERGPNLSNNSRSSSKNRQFNNRDQQNSSRRRMDSFNGTNTYPDSKQRHFHNNKKGFGNSRQNYGHDRQNNTEGEYPQRYQSARNFGNHNNRYGSHNSLHSDTGTWERRGRGHNSAEKTQEYYNDETRSLHGDQSEENWDNCFVNSSEILKNARNTAQFIQQLAEK